jgi:hypothetical protein
MVTEGPGEDVERMKEVPVSKKATRITRKDQDDVS